jgi:hypothetical protein
MSAYVKAFATVKTSSSDMAEYKGRVISRLATSSVLGNVYFVVLPA